mmetsp:Transcript_3159/g.11396  ORF Transcript_3159/g.11396 Transcript_3159/m.11396 type:complete len:230 (+) Transcript_3159:751-1440(+)
MCTSSPRRAAVVSEYATGVSASDRLAAPAASSISLPMLGQWPRKPRSTNSCTLDSSRSRRSRLRTTRVSVASSRPSYSSASTERKRTPMTEPHARPGTFRSTRLRSLRMRRGDATCIDCVRIKIVDCSESVTGWMPLRERRRRVRPSIDEVRPTLSVDCFDDRDSSLPGTVVALSGLTTASSARSGVAGFIRSRPDCIVYSDGFARSARMLILRMMPGACRSKILSISM